MELLLGYEILESYKRLSYKEWFALAEFVDNSTQSFRNNKATLRKSFEEKNERLIVKINYNNSMPGDFIRIEDNAMGMSLSELKNALILGKKPLNHQERSKYGLGLKTSSFWFGDTWTIITKKLGEIKRYSVTVDLYKILKEEKEHLGKEFELPDNKKTPFVPVLDFKEEDAQHDEHGTTVHITKLNRKLTAARAKKAKKYLRSIYRIDLQNNDLQLYFQDEELLWNKDELINRIYIDEHGKKWHRELDFLINGHRVTGWAGILKSGSREDAGFSLLQAERVIQGWPDSYKPSSLFGDQEGGINNLVNQRLTGELYLDGFEVSHTKDEILFRDSEEELIDKELIERLADFKSFAQELRFRGSDDELEAVNYNEITKMVIQRLNAPSFRAAVHGKDVLPVEIIEKTNHETFERLIENPHETFDVHIDNLIVTVIITENSSPYDPYVLCQARAEENHLTVIINKLHIYWRGLNTNELVYEFIKHCIYDGISEWKAHFRQHSLHPDTIKTIKDHLLRVELDLPF